MTSASTEVAAPVIAPMVSARDSVSAKLALVAWTVMSDPAVTDPSRLIVVGPATVALGRVIPKAPRPPDASSVWAFA